MLTSNLIRLDSLYGENPMGGFCKFRSFFFSCFVSFLLILFFVFLTGSQWQPTEPYGKSCVIWHNQISFRFDNVEKCIVFFFS